MAFPVGRAPCQAGRNRGHTQNTCKARNKEPSQPHTQTHEDTCARTQQLNHFETFILSNQRVPFLKTQTDTRRRRAPRDECVCSYLLCDHARCLNYHLAQTSGAPQHHRQTAISTCPQRGHKMEETHLDKEAPYKQALQIRLVFYCFFNFYYLNRAHPHSPSCYCVLLLLFKCRTQTEEECSESDNYLLQLASGIFIGCILFWPLVTKKSVARAPRNKSKTQ